MLLRNHWRACLDSKAKGEHGDSWKLSWIVGSLFYMFICVFIYLELFRQALCIHNWLTQGKCTNPTKIPPGSFPNCRPFPSLQWYILSWIWYLSFPYISFFPSFLLSFQNLFIFGYTGSSLLCMGFFSLRWVGATLSCSVWASPSGGCFCCGAQALDVQASVVKV